MPADRDPQTPLDLQLCARRLVQRPLTCKEHDPDLFRLIRRNEADLDRWFTQRLGYRLHVDADTARLLKSGVIPHRRPLRTRTDRAFHQLEYTLLALTLATTVAGPAVISLRDLVDQIRLAAVDAAITLDDRSTTRRAVVVVLQWMIDLGLAHELHEGVEGYASDEHADAVLRMRPDRIALLTLPALAGVERDDELVERAERRGDARQWMRCRLVEDPVMYRGDLTDDEWSELRRRLTEEARLLDEMFGLVLEARAEGVAAIDPDGRLADQAFPTGGTLGHAALLLITELGDDLGEVHRWDQVESIVARLTAEHRHFSKTYREAPHRLARDAVELLVDLRLAEEVASDEVAIEDEVAVAGEEDEDEDAGRPDIRLLPAAARFLPVAPTAVAGHEQESMW
ncbi:MAG: TIGR02678 family protein [Acidimicrobiales bacterium]|nr:TIGR02678 family protein [Acidimicrobiales bacterium]